MQGGHEVRNDREAAAYAQLLLRDDVEPGTWIEEEPCAPPDMLAAIEKETGRPCPRVELPEDLGDVATLFFLQAAEHTRHLVAPYLAGLPEEERQAALQRLVVAVQDDEVHAALETKRRQAQAAATARRR